MTLSHLSELSSFLRQIGVRAQKRLSQNFLVDANIVRKIVHAANVGEGDRILEIGPGPGALTQELLRAGASQIIAVEKDARFAQSLTRLGPQIQVHEYDFLTFPLETLKDLAPLKVVANLPYHITTPILERLCDHWPLFSSAWIMVQKEVGQRICATPLTRQHMSSCTIFVQTYCIASMAFTVSRNCFYPAPNVDSCVIKLLFRPPPVAQPDQFLAFVRKAFQQRRKMLRSTLSIRSEPYASLRPEALSLSDWVELYKKNR